MKKLIAISVVFALVAGVAFAVDVSGTVFGHVNVLQGDTGDDSKVTAGGGMDRTRIDGSGETGDGDFGGYIRAQAFTDFTIDSAYAWWKPLDQFKLIIGGFSDAFWGKEGVTGWMFNQMPYDSSVAINPGIWCGPYWGSSVFLPGGGGEGWNAPMHNRYVFFEGFQYYGAALEITPADIATINIGIPFIDTPRGEEAADVFKAAVAQVSLNLDFGNIAITYDGSNRAGMKAGDSGAIFVYFGGSFGDLNLDVGLSYHLASKNDEKPKWGTSDESLPIGVGVGLKYATDSFGVKFRTTAALAGSDKGACGDATYINASVLPFFILGDNLAAFVNVGLGMQMGDIIKAKLGEDSIMGWYFNPYLRVGAEWGPTFYAGIQASSQGGKDAVINWAVPISLMVSF